MTREERKEYMRKYRQKRIEKGICVRCGKEMAVAGKTACKICAKEAKQAQKMYYRLKCIASL